MFLDIVGWMLATSGLAGLSVGCRRAHFVDEAAEYLPACMLLQGSALMAWLGSQPMSGALLRGALCCFAALLAYPLLRGVISLPRRQQRKRWTQKPAFSVRPQRSGS